MGLDPVQAASTGSTLNHTYSQFSYSNKPFDKLKTVLNRPRFFYYSHDAWPCLCFFLLQDAYIAYWKEKSNGTNGIPSNEEAWLRPMRDGSFFSDWPQHRNDLFLSNDGSISASRFYVTGRRANPEAYAEEALMLGLRELAADSEPSMISYCPEFVYYERYVSVKKNTLLPVGVTMIGS